MSHALVETSTFDASVTVPDGGDARTAASVEVGFQALANRSKYLHDGVSNLVRLEQGTIPQADTTSSSDTTLQTITLSLSVAVGDVVEFFAPVEATPTGGTFKLYVQSKQGSDAAQDETFSASGFGADGVKSVFTLAFMRTIVTAGTFQVLLRGKTFGSHLTVNDAQTGHYWFKVYRAVA